VIDAAGNASEEILVLIRAQHHGGCAIGSRGRGLAPMVAGFVILLALRARRRRV
jgi:hypothetical protein